MIPTNNNILFKPLPNDELSQGGLFIPETVKKPNNKGIIVKVGRGTAKKPMIFKEGTIAHRVKDWGTEVIIEGELYFLMDMGAILAVE